MDLKTLKTTPPWDWPESAARVLLEAMSDRNLPDAERIVAAELAGDFTVADEQIAEVLLSVVGDRDESNALRSQAAISLGPALEYADTMGFDEDDDAPLSEEVYLGVQARLQELFDDDRVPDDVRRSVLEASVRGPLPWHTEAIERAYASDNPAWKLTAVFCMRYVRGFEPRILTCLDADNVDIRRQAVVAAGIWELDAAWSRIEEIIESGDEKPVVLAAIDAAAEIRPHDAEILLASLSDSDDTDIAAAAWEALATLDGPPTGRNSVPDELLN